MSTNDYPDPSPNHHAHPPVVEWVLDSLRDYDAFDSEPWERILLDSRDSPVDFVGWIRVAGVLRAFSDGLTEHQRKNLYSILAFCTTCPRKSVFSALHNEDLGGPVPIEWVLDAHYKPGPQKETPLAD